MSRLQRWSVAVAAAAALLLFPTWADRSDREDARLEASMIAIEREIAELERKLDLLHTQRLELELPRDDRQGRDREAAEREQDELIRLELERMKWQREFEGQSSELERELRQHQIELEEAARARAEVLERAEAREQFDRALALERARAAALDLDRAREEAAREMHGDEIHRELARMQTEMERLARQGHVREVRALRETLARMTEIINDLEAETGTKNELDKRDPNDAR